MLSPQMAKRVDRLVAIQQMGVYTPEEFGRLLGELITADNLEDVLERFPPGLSDTVKKAVAFDNRRAADDDCLYPERSPFELFFIFSQYHLNVARVLLDPQQRRLLSVVCLPTHRPEWALGLVGSEEHGFTLSLSVPAERIARAPEPANISVLHTQTQAPLPMESAVMVRETWRKMLGRTRILARERGGVDGDTYHFASSDGGGRDMAGWTWSPDHDTAPGRLVSLSHLLRKYVESDEAERPGRLDLIRRYLDWFLTPSGG
jgi:hypothetical protein